MSYKWINIAVKVPKGNYCFCTKDGYICEHIIWNMKENYAPAYCPVFVTKGKRKFSRLKWIRSGILKCWQCKKQK